MHQLDSATIVGSGRTGRARRWLLALPLLLCSSAAWAQLSGTYQVGAALANNPAGGTFSSLPNAVTGLGAGVRGPVTFQLVDATYTLTASLTIPAVGGTSATNTVRFVPAAGVTPLISGAVTANGLLILDGTDYLSFDGNDGNGGRSITIRNTGNAPAVLLRNDATYNGLRYLTLESAASNLSGGNTTTGTVVFGTTTGTTGNDFNTVADCDVRAVNNSFTTVPSGAIFSQGTGAATAGVPATTSNSDNTIQNCSISNFAAGGIFLNDTGNGGNWTVSGNNIFQNAARTNAIRAIRLVSGSGHVVSNNNIYYVTGGQGSTFYGIAVVGSAVGATISGNAIGGSAAGATGTALAASGTGATFYGMYLSLGTSTPTSIQGNTVANIASTVSGTTYAIDLVAGAVNIGTTTANTFGSTSSGTGISATNTLYGIHLEGASSGTVQGNTFAGLSTTNGALFGVYSNGSGAITISGNTLDNLSGSQTTAAALAGINATGSGVVVVSNNTLSNLSQTGLTSNLYGIQNNAVAGSNVTGNTISNLTYSGTTATNTGYGIWANGPNTVSGNTITNLTVTGSSKMNLRGIYVGASGAATTVENNTITGVTNASAGSDVQTIGLFVASTTGVLTVRNNRISNVGSTNSTTTTSTQVITGLQLGSAASGSLIERNRIWNVYGGTPGTGANADQVRGLAFAGAATFNGTIANNQLSLPAGAASQLTYGVLDNSTGGTASYLYNTVYLTGSAATATSYGFFRSTVTSATPTTPANLTLHNNIFYNERSGTAYAIGLAEAGTFSSNYNLFVTPSAAAMGSVAGTGYDFAGWKTTTSGDANSFDRRPTDLPAATIFTAPAGGDLHINPAYYATASIIESGGTVVSVTNDYDNDPRFGAAGYTGTGTAPDLGADEYNATPPANMAYDPATGTAVTQITGAVAAGSTNQAVIRVALTTTGSANPLRVTQLNFSADGTTANGALPANISNARVYYTGASSTFGTSTQFGTGAVAPAFSAAGGFSVTGSQPLLEGVNYFFLTYDVTAGAPTGDVIDGVLTGVQIGSGAVSSIPAATGAPAGNRPILGPLAGSYTVGYELGTENYPSLTAAVADLVGRGVATGQSVTFTLTNPGATKPYDATTATTAANQETFPLVIPAVALGTGQTLRIVPAAGVTPLISGSVASTGGGLIILDGTDYLSIDGTSGTAGARTITIRNTGSGAAVLLRNDATYNSLRYLTLESGVTGNAGTVMFGTTTGSTGNDFNTVANCDVRDLSVAPNTVPTNGIYSLGTGVAPTAPALPAATANSDNTVQGCNIYNYTNGGVYLSNTGSGDNWTVGGATAALGNSFYQMAARTSQLLNIRLGTGNNHVVSNNQVYGSGSVTGSFYGVSVVGAGSGHTITNNTIGGAAAGATGAALAVGGAGNTFYGIYLSLGSVTPSSVQGNVVANVASTVANSTYGIDMVAGTANIGTVAGNTIGSSTGSSISASNALVGILVESGAAATISNNTVGGLTNAAGQLAGIQTTGAGVTPVSANTVSNLSQTGTTSNLYGIQANGSTGSSVTGNTISNLTYSGTTATNTGYGIFASGSNTISNNTITNLTVTGANKMNLRGIYVGGTGAAAVVENNTVTGVLNASAGTDVQTIGIFVGPTSGTMGAVTVRGNRISNVGTTNTTTTTSTEVITGLQVASAAAGSLIERNRIWNVYGSTPGTDAVRGLAVQGSYSGTFSNNQISLAAGSTSQLSYGVQDASTGGRNNFFYNSVYLAPASAASSGSSFGFFRSAATTPAADSLRNNIFYNGRVADTGAASFAIGTATNAGFRATSSNYNLFVNTSAATVGNFGGTAYTFADWKTQTGGDASSLSETSTSVPAANLFADLATGNLNVNPANPEAWYANGNGVQLPGQTVDFDNATAGRSTTVIAGGTDIGSDEFTPTSTPPLLTVSAAPALGGTQNFSLGGRLLATVTYGSTGTVPTATTGRYYSGTNPTVAATTTRYTNYFTELEATGGANYTYSLVLHYDDALLGLVQTEASQRLLKRNANGTFEFFPNSVADAAANTITASALTSFGQLFGNDETAPLPVTMSSFQAFRRGSDAELDWTTALEKNSAGYEIQVATDGISYRKLGFVESKAANSSTAQHYQFIDREDGKQGHRYYRLRQLDLDGKASYSPVQIVSFGEVTAPLLVSASPNPFAAELTLTMSLPKPGGTVPLTITDGLGRTVYAQPVTLPAGTSHLELNQLSNLPNGLYMIHVALNGTTQHLKVVKR